MSPKMRHEKEEQEIIRQQDMELERIRREALEQPMGQETELAGVLRLMNEDQIEKGTKFRKVDFLSRLHEAELSGLIVLESFSQGLQVLPEEMAIVGTKKKRLSVSLDGLGRKENVQMVAGERSRRTAGFMEKMGSLFRPQGENEK